MPHTTLPIPDLVEARRLLQGPGDTAHLVSALTTIGQLGHRDVDTPLLLPLLIHADPEVVAAALAALSSLASYVPLPLARELVGTSTRRVRRPSLLVLSSISRIEEELPGLLTAPSPHTRRRAAYLMARGKATDDLVNLLLDQFSVEEEPAVSAQIADALKTFASPLCATVLIGRLHRLLASARGALFARARAVLDEIALGLGLEPMEVTEVARRYQLSEQPSPAVQSSSTPSGRTRAPGGPVRARASWSTVPAPAPARWRALGLPLSMLTIGLTVSVVARERSDHDTPARPGLAWTTADSAAVGPVPEEAALAAERGPRAPGSAGAGAWEGALAPIGGPAPASRDYAGVVVAIAGRFPVVRVGRRLFVLRGMDRHQVQIGQALHFRGAVVGVGPSGAFIVDVINP